MPVEEVEEMMSVVQIDGDIPTEFPEGVYIRNGSNPLFGAPQSAVSVFGKVNETFFEGEGMLHALYFVRDNHGKWSLSYKNKYVETETFLFEKEKKKPAFLPMIEGNPVAIMVSIFLNMIRFRKVCKYFSNTNIIEHGGRYFATAENHMAQEINISTLETIGSWDINKAWENPFMSHPKKVRGRGELLIGGLSVLHPCFILGVVSADGKRLEHKVDINLNRNSFSHDIGITESYNVIMDQPLVMDAMCVINGGPLIKFQEKSYARFGVMPRYGSQDSVRWFYVKTFCMFHIVNCFEDQNEVVVWGIKANSPILPGPEFGRNKFEWFSKGFEDGKFHSRFYEWRLDMKTGKHTERYLTGPNVSFELPVINEYFTGVKNKYAYAQVADSIASSKRGMMYFNGIAKVSFDESKESNTSSDIKVEIYWMEKNCYCSGHAFVPKKAGCEEDDGWVISFVHNEESNLSEVHIIDSRSFTSKPIAKITMPTRVPYGFHGAFFPLVNSKLPREVCNL